MFDDESNSDGSFFGEEDWFLEPEEVKGEEVADGTQNDDAGQESQDIFEELLVAAEPLKPGQYAFIQAELYNSGCTQHISPYHKDFESFTEIPPMSFSAANKQKFSTSGNGEMVIDVPNSVETSQL